MPDSGSVTVVPALSGLGAPWWRPDALAGIEGIGPASEPAHVVRATLEGVAAQVTLLARAAAIDLGRPLTLLRVDGGLTRSRVLMQMQADLLQVPVEVAASPHATAAGVGALARLGAGAGQTLYDVVRRDDSSARYEPAIDAAEAAGAPGALRARRGPPPGHTGGVMTEDRRYDVAIIGAGVVGTAIARQLARYRLRTVLLERADDVGTGTSKANTAIVHTGFDTEPGTLESVLVRRGHALLHAYADAAGIALERTGAVLVAWDAEQAARLDDVLTKARANGYGGAARLALDELYRREPHLERGASGAVAIPDESIICPWSTSIAFATEAIGAGVDLRLGAPVTDVRRDGADWLLDTPRGTVRADWVVNAAGLASDLFNRRFGHDEFTIAPRRGQLIVFDKLARGLVSGIVLPVPTERTKGVLVAPTVYGNVLARPHGRGHRRPGGHRHDGSRVSTPCSTQVAASSPTLVDEEVTATYAGRARRHRAPGLPDHHPRR